MKSKNSEGNYAYVALLRGINVGGHKKVPMAELREALTKAGFINPKTVLASGNVVLEATTNQLTEVTEKVNDVLTKQYSFQIPTLIYPAQVIENMEKLNPFHDIEVTKETRRYVTFITDGPASKLTLPYENEDGSFKIISENESAVFSVLILGKSKSTDAMTILEKTYGKKITTRNWNTIIKILKLL